jgi:hypothetical protein
MEVSQIEEALPETSRGKVKARNSSPQLAPRPSIRSLMMASRHAEVSLEFHQTNPENPRTFPTAKKALITGTILLSAFITYVETRSTLLIDF